ncbi:MAG: discoidin domain-containing protein [Planctomycetota bacterium]
MLVLGTIAPCFTSARAALIPGITASADRGPSVGFNLANLVNGAGLPGDVPTLEGQHAYQSFTNAWQSGPPVNITFDLHAEYFVSTMCVWPWSSNASVSARDVQVSYSADGTSFYALPDGPGEFPYVGNWGSQWQTRYDFSPVVATHMRIKILSNWGYRSPSGFAYTGLSEVQFGGAPTPEPATLCLLALGAAAVLRRRRGH